MIWQLGNTTIRNPLRIRDLLIAYNDNGTIEGLYDSGNTEAQVKLYELFKKNKLISSNMEGSKNTSFYGRKLRLTLFEMGLIADNKSSDYSQGEITKTGKALIHSKTDAEIKNIYLRILFNIESRKKGYKTIFRPIPFIINVLLGLEKKSITHITFHEFALILQNFNADKTVNEYIDEISDLRKEHSINKGNLRQFYKKKYEIASQKEGIAVSTIKFDYPDVTFRYIKLSGLFIEKGHGIKLNPQYTNLFNELAKDAQVSETKKDYYKKLTNFPSLPFDNKKDLLVKIVQDNAKKIKDSYVDYKTPDINVTSEILELARVKQEDEIRKLSEDNFAMEQRNKTQVILRWFERLNERFQEELDDEYIDIENDARPQYLEWVIWRAFLSINCLKNKPYDSRKFRIDSSYRPIHHAPAGTADLVFEFEKFILVVEVTFTTSDRQVAAEGVPVQKHVAKISYDSDKPTFCLFLAPNIDINTTKIFRTDTEYILENSGEDFEQKINIVPLPISRFKDFFEVIPKAHPRNPDMIYSILNDCVNNKHLANRDWQSYIEQQFEPHNHTIKQFLQS